MLFADNEAATLAAPRPLGMVPARSGWSARGDSDPDLHGLNVPRLPIAPRADDDRHELVRPTGIEPVPPRWQRGMLLHTQAERGPVGLTGPIAIPSVVKEPALASWWAARDSNPMAPERGTGLRPVSGPSARTALLGDSATPRCRFASRPTCLLRQNLPVTWRAVFSRQAQNKKGLLGCRPRRPGSR